MGHESGHEDHVDDVVDEAEVREGHYHCVVAHGSGQEPRVVVIEKHALKAEHGRQVVAEEAHLALVLPVFRVPHLVELNEGVCKVVEDTREEEYLVETVPHIFLDSGKALLG